MKVRRRGTKARLTIFLTHDRVERKGGPNLSNKVRIRENSLLVCVSRHEVKGSHEHEGGEDHQTISHFECEANASLQPPVRLASRSRGVRSHGCMPGARILRTVFQLFFVGSCRVEAEFIFSPSFLSLIMASASSLSTEESGTLSTLTKFFRCCFMIQYCSHNSSIPPSSAPSLYSFFRLLLPLFSLSLSLYPLIGVT